MTTEDSSVISRLKSSNVQTKDAHPVKPRKVRPMNKPRFTCMQVYVLSTLIFISSVLTHNYLGYDIPRSLVTSIILAYLPSYFDGSEYTVQGRYWPWFAHHPLWRKLYAFFDAKIHFEKPLKEGQQYILSSHPHGILSVHHWHYLCNLEFNKYFPGNHKRHLGASIVFKIPLFREWMLWGGIVDADSSLAHALLTQGYSMLALSGGISEQVRAAQGQHILYIRRRTGIFKLALQYGVPIVPCYNFGENDLIKTYPILTKLRDTLADKYRLPIWFGHGQWFTWMPYKKQLVTYVGAPIEVEKTPEPTKEQVLALQQKYIDDMVEMFNKHKAKHGYPDAKLEVM